MTRPLNKQGFTILELMIATVVFSVILLVVATALVQLGNMYYKGQVTVRTQETARQVADEISQEVQFSGQAITTGTATLDNSNVSDPLVAGAICIGNTRYTYATNRQVDPNMASGSFVPGQHKLRHALWRDTKPSTSACDPVDLRLADPSASIPNANGRELLSPNMRLANNFGLACSGTSSQQCTLTLTVLYGDDDLMRPDANNPTGCGNVIGSQWCAASTIRAKISQRLQQAGS